MTILIREPVTARQVNSSLEEMREEIGQVRAGTPALTLPDGSKMWVDRTAGKIKVQYSDGTIETWSKD